MVISTQVLKALAEKSVKGSGRLPQLAITNVMCIQVKSGVLSLITTDGSSNLVVSTEIGGEDFYAATDSELFYKLVSKTTTEKITIKVTDNSLNILANGAYSLPLILDEEGSMAKIPDINVDGPSYECKSSEFKKLLVYNKNTVLKDMSVPIYTGYCLKGGYGYTFCISGGCVTKLNIDENISALLRPQTVELLDVFGTTDNITVCVSDKTISFTTKNIRLYSSLLDGINEFATAKLKSLVVDKTNFEGSITVNKNCITNALDRLSLFISPEEANAVEFNISSEDKLLTLKNKSNAGIEQVQLVTSDTSNIIDTVQYVDYKDLKTLTDAVKTDNVVLRYNVTESLCVESDGANMFMTYLVAEDENLDEMEDTDEELTDDLYGENYSE